MNFDQHCELSLSVARLQVQTGRAESGVDRLTPLAPGELLVSPFGYTPMRPVLDVDGLIKRILERLGRRGDR